MLQQFGRIRAMVCAGGADSERHLLGESSKTIAGRETFLEL